MRITRGLSVKYALHVSMTSRVGISNLLISVTEILAGSYVREEGLILVPGSESTGVGVGLQSLQ